MKGNYEGSSSHLSPCFLNVFVHYCLVQFIVEIRTQNYGSWGRGDFINLCCLWADRPTRLASRLAR